MNSKLRLALILGMLFVVCVSLTSAEAEEGGKAEPEPGAEPEAEAEPKGDEDATGSGKTAGQTGQSKTGEKNPAAVPVALPASVMVGMALVAKYIL